MTTEINEKYLILISTSLNMPKKKSNKSSSNKEQQKKLLKSLVEEIAGTGSELIVDILFNKTDVNEFLIAKKMELTINQVRNILYKLSAEGLVTFIRKKDKRKGWYIYYWTLDTEKCFVKLESTLVSRIKDLQNRLHKRETKRYYICKGCDIEVSEETALEHGFTCEECAEVYELADHEKPIRDIKTRITKTKKDLALIREELEKTRDKKMKKRVREGKIKPINENKKKSTKKKTKKKKPSKKTTKKSKKKLKKTGKQRFKKATKKKPSKKTTRKSKKKSSKKKKSWKKKLKKLTRR
ncbi:MAG: hypothetical protein ACP5D2_01915 [Candidatus Nanoarchaeia archaeon]